MMKNPLTIENGSAPSAQRRIFNPQGKGPWRQCALLTITLAAASAYGQQVIVNNLNQPIGGFDGPIGTDANNNDFLLAQEFTLPAANNASYLLNKVTLYLRPNAASGSVTVSIWDVDANNNPNHQMFVVASHVVSSQGNVDFVPTNLMLVPGVYYVVATPTTGADNAKVDWAYTSAWTNWTGTGVLDGFADTSAGSWISTPPSGGPFLLSVQATPTVGTLATSQEAGVTSLAWPATLAGFVAETATNLPPSGWQPLTNQPIQVGNQMTLSNAWTDSSRFFRLRQQFAVNNLDQVSETSDTIGTDNNGSDALLGQIFTLPAGNYAINKVTLLLTPVMPSGNANITVSIWNVGANNLPTTKISTVSSALVTSLGDVDFIPSAPITLSGGKYYVEVAPTTSADNAKISWVYTASTFWTGLGTLSGSADEFTGTWEYFPIGNGPYQMSIQATPQ